MEKRTFKIAMIAPVWLPVPPKAYGGSEQIVSVLTEQLVARGHDVTLYASGGSVTAAKLRSFHDKAPGVGTYADQLSEMCHVLTAYREIERFDIAHDHTSSVGPALGAFATAVRPVVHTVHNAPTFGKSRPFYNLVHDRLDLVAVSEAQRRSAPELRFTDVVHNGLDIDKFPFSTKKSDYVFYIGRMWEQKGAHLAIDAARAAGRRLFLASKSIDFPFEHDYFNNMIKPRLGPDVEYLGEVGFEEKVALYRDAACTIVPTNWDEPFGLTCVESLACGTAVVALRRGGTAEIVDHGTTGWLADTVDELAAYVERAGEISPTACRLMARSRFDASVMAAAYESLYARVLDGRE